MGKDGWDKDGGMPSDYKHDGTLRDEVTQIRMRRDILRAKMEVCRAVNELSLNDVGMLVEYLKNGNDQTDSGDAASEESAVGAVIAEVFRDVFGHLVESEQRLPKQIFIRHVAFTYCRIVGARPADVDPASIELGHIEARRAAAC